MARLAGICSSCPRTLNRVLRVSASLKNNCKNYWNNFINNNRDSVLLKFTSSSTRGPVCSTVFNGYAANTFLVAVERNIYILQMQSCVVYLYVFKRWIDCVQFGCYVTVRRLIRDSEFRVLRVFTIGPY